MITVNGIELNIFDHIYYDNSDSHGNIDGEIIIIDECTVTNRLLFLVPKNMGVAWIYKDKVEPDNIIKLQFDRWACAKENLHYHVKRKIFEYEWQLFI